MYVRAPLLSRRRRRRSSPRSSPAARASGADRIRRVLGSGGCYGRHGGERGDGGGGGLVLREAHERPRDAAAVAGVERRVHERAQRSEEHLRAADGRVRGPNEREHDEAEDRLRTQRGRGRSEPKREPELLLLFTDAQSN
jgi:hypothetical protein